MPATREEWESFGNKMLMFGAAVTFFFRVAARCRPLYRALLRWGIKVFDARARRGEKGAVDAALSLRLMLLFEQKAAWDEVKPLVQARASASDRLNNTKNMVALYWLNGRFDEMRQAIEYWKSMSEEWVLAHRNKARKSQNISRTICDLPLEKKADALWKTWKSGSFYVNNYRDSRIAAALMNLSEKDDDDKAREAVDSLQVERNPVILASMNFDEEFSQQLGADEATFNQIVRDAERIPYRDPKDRNLKNFTETTEELMASPSSTQTQQQENNR